MAEMWTDSMTRRPAGPLRGSIEAYMGYQAVGFAPGLQHRLPSRHMTFVVSIGSSIDVRWETDPARRPERYRCVVGGLQTAAATIAHPGSQAGIAISLSPLGARAVFGVPAAELSDLSLEAADLLGHTGEELWERLQHTSSWRERFDICDQVLRPQMGERSVSRELAHCWQAIVASGGRVPVGRLAADTGYSRQHLTRLFRREFGLGPKLASRIVRLERAQRALLEGGPSATPSEVAPAVGYADQAHLSREFAALAGCPPGVWLAEELPILQDPGGAVV